jgi:hypothetical protein
LWGGRFVEAGADARQKRSRHFGVGGDVKAGINGGEEGLLLFERSAAISAPGEMCAQISVRFNAAGGCFD